MKLIRRFINIKMGAAGALVMGLIVFFINIDFGWWPATTAAMKQAAYTFLFGGLIIRLLEVIVLSIRSMPLALFIAVTATSIVTIALVYFVHSLRGTPMPFESTLPTIMMAPPGFLVLAWRKKVAGSGL
jgi:hypothetical protein